MARCEQCGNEYERCFTITIDDAEHTFDCFECAIQLLAPLCAHCGCRIIGHGLEGDGTVFCCAHCASQHGVEGLADNNLSSTL